MNLRLSAAARRKRHTLPSARAANDNMRINTGQAAAVYERRTGAGGNQLARGARNR